MKVGMELTSATNSNDCDSPRNLSDSGMFLFCKCPQNVGG